MALLNMTAETTITGCRRNVFAFVSLFLLILIPYSNTFDASWHFDDTTNIIKNKPLHLTDLSLENIKRTFFASYKGEGNLYRPTACLSFALNYYLGGTEVAGYHIVNLSIHFLAACFLFLFIHHTLNLPILKSRYQSTAYFFALLSTALWAINPMQTQAVTYIVQRMASMAGLFCIMAMYFYVKGKISTFKSIKTVHYISCCICGILALGSKENAIMLPMTLLAYDLFLIEGITKNNLKRYSFFLAMVLVVCIVIALVLAGPSILNPKSLVDGYQNKGFTLSERLLTEPRIILFYISLLLYPMPDRLCLEHGITLSTGLITPVSTLVSILTIAFVLCLAVVTAKKRPFISFCIIFFFMNHLIEASVFPLELIFEHRNYFPSMLFFVPLALLLSMGFSYFSSKPFFQLILATFIIFTLVAWGHGTFVRNAVWRTHKTLLLDCVEKYPDLSRPHHNLGAYYGRMDMPEKAVPEYLMALSKENINNLVARNWTCYNLGAIYQKLGRDEEAFFYYDHAQKYQPNFAPTHVGKGLLFMRKGRYAEAISAFQKAIEADPENVSAYGNLGFLFLLTGKNEKAIANLKQASSIEPDNAKIMRHLGIAYKLQGNSKKAFIQFKNAHSRDSTDPLTLLNLAAFYAEKGMNKQKNQFLSQFFMVFGGNEFRLKKFIDSLATKPETEDVLVSHRKHLLTVLADACLNRSRRYGNLVVDCLRKKSEQTKTAAHLFE